MLMNLGGSKNSKRPTSRDRSRKGPLGVTDVGSEVTPVLQQRYPGQTKISIGAIKTTEVRDQRVQTAHDDLALAESARFPHGDEKAGYADTGDRPGQAVVAAQMGGKLSQSESNELSAVRGMAPRGIAANK